MTRVTVSDSQLAALSPRLRPSWLRCVNDYSLPASAISLDTLLCAAELRQARARMGVTMRICDPELDRLQAIVSTLDYNVLLADPQGIVVAHRGDAPQEKGCRRWHLWSGANWNEARVGTNGIGTCLIEQVPVTVHREQHWSMDLRYLSCSAVPFYGPDGQLAGALDASSTRPDPSERISTMMEAVLIDAARRLERRSFLEAFRAQTVILLGEGSGISLPMVALDDSRAIVGATFAARRLPGLGDLENHPVRFDLGSEAALSPGFEEAERGVVQGALAMCQGRVTAAASLLGISRSTLHRKIKAMGGRNNLAHMTARAALQAQERRVSAVMP